MEMTDRWWLPRPNGARCQKPKRVNITDTRVIASDGPAVWCHVGKGRYALLPERELYLTRGQARQAYAEGDYTC